MKEAAPERFSPGADPGRDQGVGALFSKRAV